MHTHCTDREKTDETDSRGVAVQTGAPLLSVIDELNPFRSAEHFLGHFLRVVVVVDVEK